MSNYINEKVSGLVRRFHTRDPFELLDAKKAVIREVSDFQNLKGAALISCRTSYVLLNSNLSDSEKRIVAAHELGHLILHRNLLQVAPMKDTAVYDMVSATEYEANLFAADLLIADEDIESLSPEELENEDYFSLCSRLYTTPELMSFKLFSMMKRGKNYNLPVGLDSRFLAK